LALAVPKRGVGISTSKGLVEENGGKIWAECEPGQTTTF